MSAGTIRRFIAKRGEPLTYTEFTEGSRDAYEDVAYTADPTPTTISGIRSDATGTPKQMLDETGQKRTIDVEFIVASASVVADADDMTKRAPSLTDASGRIYTILGVGHEGVPVGARRLLCSRQAP